jgi:hypothetical protein
VASGDFDYLIEDDPDPERVCQLVSGLVAFNDSRAELENRRPLGVFVRRGGGFTMTCEVRGLKPPHVHH